MSRGLRDRPLDARRVVVVVAHQRAVDHRLRAAGRAAAAGRRARARAPRGRPCRPLQRLPVPAELGHVRVQRPARLDVRGPGGVAVAQVPRRAGPGHERAHQRAPRSSSLDRGEGERRTPMRHCRLSQRLERERVVRAVDDRGRARAGCRWNCARIASIQARAFGVELVVVGLHARARDQQAEVGARVAVLALPQHLQVERLGLVVDRVPVVAAPAVGRGAVVVEAPDAGLRRGGQQLDVGARLLDDQLAPLVGGRRPAPSAR